MEAIEIVKYIEENFHISPVVEKNEYYIYPTFCHNLNPTEGSNKLYLYKNEEDESPLFYCYTQCSEAFSVYQLIQKYHKLRGQEVSFKEAYRMFHGANFTPKFNKINEETEIKKVTFTNPLSIKLPAYPETTLEIFSHYSEAHPWSLEGIDELVLAKYQVSFSASYEGVIIPHRDWRGVLVGLRIRTYNPDKVAHYKYMPMLINNIYYRHPLSLNLYGIFQNQKAIRKHRKVILVESEKSVLQAESMLDGDNIVLAVCGSSISTWQINMLVYYLGVEEVLIGFDKEYSNYSEAFAYVQKIKAQVIELSNFARVGVLIDNNDVFQLKDSPFDKTAKDFYKLTTWYI